eukprot:Amastigsp_a678908_3.p5 type:complete len:111 gc:universal Amastigsp_a678908_3:663-995(+)
MLSFSFWTPRSMCSYSSSQRERRVTSQKRCTWRPPLSLPLRATFAFCKSRRLSVSSRSFLTKGSPSASTASRSNAHVLSLVRASFLPRARSTVALLSTAARSTSPPSRWL